MRKLKKMMTRKNFGFFVLSLLVFTSILGYSTNSLAYSTREIGENQWKSSNNQQYLEISASNYFELGKLEGQFLAEQIIYLDGLLEMLVVQNGLDMQEFLYYCFAYEEFIPECYKQEMRGIADVLPLPYEKILLQNVWLDIYYGQVIPAMALQSITMGCTAIAVNHRFLDTIGQNLDFGSAFSPSISWIRYKVGESPVVFCMMLGSAKIPTGKSEYVLCTTNLVQTLWFGNIGMPYSICSRYAFETSTNAEDFRSKVICDTSSWNYIILNNPLKARRAIPIGIESLCGFEVYELGEDFIVRTNTYTSEDLKPYLIDPEYSLDRQERATEIIENNKGRFSLQECGTLLSDENIVKKPTGNPLDVITIAFFFSNGIITYFGIGNPKDSDWGRLLF